jgi:hypothetical protein
METTAHFPFEKKKPKWRTPEYIIIIPKLQLVAKSVATPLDKKRSYSTDTTLKKI